MFLVEEREQRYGLDPLRDKDYDSDDSGIGYVTDVSAGNNISFQMIIMIIIITIITIIIINIITLYQGSIAGDPDNILVFLMTNCT